jgi:hypothetical protein
MANPGNLQAVCYESESGWAENTATFATLRIPTVGVIENNLTHEKLPTEKTVQYRSDGSDFVLGTQGGSIKMKSYLTGHGSSVASGVTITAYETFLGRIFGGTSAVASSTGITATGGTVNIPTVSAASGFSAGSLCFFGARGDGDGEGQAYAIASHSGSNLTLLTDLAGAPANGAVIGAPSMIFPSTDPTSTGVTGTRFLVQSANLQYRAHGCYPTAVTIAGLNAGELPTIEHEWGVSAWGYSTATFPSTTSTHTANPAVVASGSFWINDVGSTTNATRSIRNFTINYTLGMQPLEGPGGIWQYQKVIGARRISDVIKLTWTEDADAATTTPVLPGYGTATTRKHILYTLSTADGSRVAFYFPSVCIDNVAVQKIDNNLNRLTVSATAYVGSTLTSELTRSPMRIAFG